MSAGAGPRGPEGAIRAIVLMGVSGCGKSTVGEALARRLGAVFRDGDDHHPPGNVAKMRAGEPLDDADRAPWLARLNALLREGMADGRPQVLACSALKRAYRERLAEGLAGVLFVHLAGSEALIAARLAARSHRYMPATLLRSQFDALEPPDDALTVDVARSVDELVDEIAARVQSNEKP